MKKTTKQTTARPASAPGRVRRRRKRAATARSVEAAKRRKRVEYLLVIRGLSIPEITTRLYDEGLISSKRRASAERTVRGDVAQILDGLPPAKAAAASPLGLAKYLRRNETLFERLMGEFEQVEGVTETTITYPNGTMMTIERRSDRGGLRIRAAELAQRCAETIAKAEGVAALLANRSEGEAEGDQKPATDEPSLRLVPPDPARMTPEQRKRLAETLRASHPILAAVYDHYDDPAGSPAPAPRDDDDNVAKAN